MSLHADLLEQDLVTVAETFVELQQARHEADYDLTRRFARPEVLDLIATAEAAFVAWRGVRNGTPAKVFLIARLAWKEWRP